MKIWKFVLIIILIVEPIWAALLRNHYQYAVVIDAGSSGSRVYLYKWPRHSGEAKDLLAISPVTNLATGQPLVRKVTPGLSDLKDRPGDALEYIRILLDFAQEPVH